jgi:hypothetical protein
MMPKLVPDQVADIIAAWTKNIDELEQDAP